MVPHLANPGSATDVVCINCFLPVRVCPLRQGEATRDFVNLSRYHFQLTGLLRGRSEIETSKTNSFSTDRLHCTISALTEQRSSLEVMRLMRYVNPRFTYLLTALNSVLATYIKND